MSWDQERPAPSDSVWGEGRAGEEALSSNHCLYGISPGGGGAGLGCRGWWRGGC